VRNIHAWPQRLYVPPYEVGFFLVIFPAGSALVTIRIAALVDGFNLYHSIDDEIKNGNLTARSKWLDIGKLVTSEFLYSFGKDATLERLHYFTSLTIWNSAKMSRHKAYIRALKAHGPMPVFEHYGQFREKKVSCQARPGGCSKEFTINVEKRTDVAIAVQLFELFYSDQVDACLLISGDTDLVPAIDTTKRLFKRTVGVALPHSRSNYELKQVASPIFHLTPEHYKKYVLPSKIADGTKSVTIPKEWDV
jgi:uncharacterized LabA/DUF88 family protein